MHRRRLSMGYRGAACVAIAVLASVLTSGCMKIETHVYVRPPGTADMAFAVRMPASLAAMLKDLGGESAAAPTQLPPGAKFSERDEGFEHIWEFSMAGPINPAAGMCKVTKQLKLLSTTYRVAIRPQQAMAPLGPMLQRSTVRPVALEAQGEEPGEPQPESPLDLSEALQGPGGPLGGTMPPLDELDLSEVLKQMAPALYAHMPGRLTDTNGERVDESTARWQLLPPPTLEEKSEFWAESELADMPILEDVAERLNRYHGTHITPEGLAALMGRGLLPNPPVEDRSKAGPDLHLYGELVIAVTGLDELIDPEKTEAVMKALKLTDPEPSLAVATKAAKRVRILREREDVTELTVQSLAEILSAE